MPPNGRKTYPVPYVISRRRRRPLGLKDPAYVADTPHDFWIGMQRRERFKSTRSAAELEDWIRQAPALVEVLALGLLDRARYDGLGQLLAKLVLEHVEHFPQDRGLPEVVRRRLENDYPLVFAAGVSTPQWVWAWAVVQRIADAHQEDD